MKKIGLLLCAASLTVFSETYEFKGEPDAKSGWVFIQSEEGNMVYIPYEGMYESKGGRIQSPRITLDKPENQGAFYQLSFI